ncbi:MATE family efflux transporter [uncultured Endozoicomonas sp.]|uniref:MATE family efflux transporter n=1 Tax=uncultured Endozoicomonas sp. TaxID=432652 RepID=UPI0026136082|nr:MATE family efflux transporter [uncultured Endozoicomonas sp.]
MEISLPVWHRVWHFAWPAIVSNISVPLLGLVDSAVLGHLPSPEYLGGVAIAATLFSMVFWAFGFLRMGTTGLVAQAKGRGDRDACRKWLLQSVAFAAAIGVLLILFSSPIFSVVLPFFDASAVVARQADIYFSTRIFSAPAVLINYALIGWLIGMQKPKGPLFILVLGNVVNIVLDLWFVLGLGWATQGAALATVIADYLALAGGLYIVNRTLQETGGEFSWAMLMDAVGLRRLVLLNRHLFVRTLCLLFVQSFFTAQGARLGDDILAANALLLNLMVLISNGLDGFAHAAEALTGEAIGRKDRKLFAQVIRVTGWCSLICGGLFCLILGVGGHALLGLLTDIPEVVDQASVYLPWLVVMPLIAVWCFWLDGVFIGAVRTDMMQHTMLAATVLVFLPLWFVFKGLGNQGLWLAYTLFMGARGVGLIWVFRRFSARDRWFADRQELV